MGVTALLATCAFPDCWHTGVVRFDAAGVDDQTPFPSIVSRARFVCTRCGGRSVRIMPDWSGVQGERAGEMMFGWLRERRAARELVAADADQLMQTYGADAYRVARGRAAAAKRGNVVDGDRGDRHWDRVRGEIARRTGRDRRDTATRMLDG